MVHFSFSRSPIHSFVRVKVYIMSKTNVRRPQKKAPVKKRTDWDVRRKSFLPDR